MRKFQAGKSQSILNNRHFRLFSVLFLMMLWWYYMNVSLFGQDAISRDDESLGNHNSNVGAVDVQLGGTSLQVHGENDGRVIENSNLDLELMHLGKLEKLEKEIRYWGQMEPDQEKTVFFWGSEFFFSMQYSLWRKAFEKLGFRVIKRNKYGSISKSELTRVLKKYSAVFCLSYEITGCFNPVSLHKKVPRHKKINHALYLRDILWNKASICKTINEATHGDLIFDDYVFQCWIFPEHYKGALAYGERNPDTKLMIKPVASGGGRGIKIMEDLQALQTWAKKGSSNPYIIQNYLKNPHLINGYKWDIRAYCVMTSSVPMRAYMFGRGIVRFASLKFQANQTQKKAQFLTNTSLGTKWKKQNVTSITWSFDDLKNYFEESGKSYDHVMNQILGAVSVVFLSAEFQWKKLYKAHQESCSNCFKHFGLDIILDSNLNARVIEANGQPGLVLTKQSTDHYSTTKRNMVTQLIQMLYNQEPTAKKLASQLIGCPKALLELLDKDDWEYLLEYLNERENKSAYYPVYPNKDLASIHTALLERQTNLPPNRAALHKVLLFLENKK